MNKGDKTFAGLAVIGLLGAALTLSADYITIQREERKKRKAIERWKQENLACIDRMSERLMKMVNDGDVTSKEFWQAYHEEMAYLEIVRNQPMC